MCVYVYIVEWSVVEKSPKNKKIKKREKSPKKIYYIKTRALLISLGFGPHTHIYIYIYGLVGWS